MPRQLLEVPLVHEDPDQLVGGREADAQLVGQRLGSRGGSLAANDIDDLEESAETGVAGPLARATRPAAGRRLTRRRAASCFGWCALFLHLALPESRSLATDFGIHSRSSRGVRSSTARRERGCCGMQPSWGRAGATRAGVDPRTCITPEAGSTQ